MSRGNQMRRVSSCLGKQRFMTYGFAAKMARAQNRRKEEGYAPYACQHCGGFHVGTSIGGRRPPIKVHDLRKVYAVWASNGGPEQLVGYSSHANGEDLVRFVGPGWNITRITEKR
ncbi:MAG: hypothetical protein JSS29_16785 [Proteobacteria bacterium]|nr:hypothetical protein [Pseudomonadota bacterium]